MSTQTFSELSSVVETEAKKLSQAKVPIITVSGTYRKELLKQYECFSKINSEAIFSRAHYSMAEAVRQACLDQKLTAHVVDPTNFVDTNDWSKIDFTEFVGQQMARNKPLKWLKDKIDTVVRNKLPITDAITPPLESLIEPVTKPIISMHYEAGNVAQRNGKKVLQVITDPHVRPQYLDGLAGVDKLTRHSDNQTKPINQLTNQLNNQITYAVFDSQTKAELMAKAKELGKQLSEDQVEVTGPPVDPRISKLLKKKNIYEAKRPLNIAITTGGLGTNLAEIKHVLEELEPLLKTYPEKIRLFLYAGTHRDFRNFFEKFASENNLRIGDLDDTKARVRILYEDSIVDANENLIEHMFPWADVILTKPSGDMAYEAIACGAVPLFLEPWGEWEENVQKRLTELHVGFDFDSQNAHAQMLKYFKFKTIIKAQMEIRELDSNYFQGARNIVKLQQSLLG